MCIQIVDTADEITGVPREGGVEGSNPPLHFRIFSRIMCTYKISSQLCSNLPPLYPKLPTCDFKNCTRISHFASSLSPHGPRGFCPFRKFLVSPCEPYPFWNPGYAYVWGHKAM